MKKFFLGAMIGLVIELTSALGVYSLLAHFSRNYIDSSPFLVEYPLIACVLVVVYLLSVKKSYKIALGVFVGYLLSIISLSFLLIGA